METEQAIGNINGENPAHIHVGDTYADLGATITGPTDADKNLGLKYFLNGTLVSDIVLDTTQVATDTIDYVATDPNGLTATSTRTILIEAVSPPAPPPASASSTVSAAVTATSTRAVIIEAPAGDATAADTSTPDATGSLPIVDAPHSSPTTPPPRPSHPPP